MFSMQRSCFDDIVQCNKSGHNIQRLVVANRVFYMVKLGTVPKWSYEAGGHIIQGHNKQSML